MGQVVPFSDPANYVLASRRIRKLWNEVRVEIKPHAQKRMKNRDLDILDIQYAIRYGRIVSHSQPENLWRYNVQGKLLDGRRISCIVEIDTSFLIIISVISRL